MTASRVVFLDKDGTLIEDLPYNVDPRRIRLAPGAAEALRMWGTDGWRVAIVTNQSGVARGYFPIDALDRVAENLEATLRGFGVGWAGFYACPHLPEGVNEYAIDCDCRKPAAGLIRSAAHDLGIEPAGTWFIGDTWMDMAAGRAVGCRTILVGPEWRQAGTYPVEARPDHAVPDLLAAAHITLAETPAPRQTSTPPPTAAPRLTPDAVR
jgi:D-glycero-D-manno-heptose 1,7-bisphosphate phosphatase